MVHGHIHIGSCDKPGIVKDYLAQHPDIDHIYIIGDQLTLDTELPIYQLPFSESDMYKHYYPLLGAINPRSLVILNEGLRRENRYDLKYNCIRKYMIQTHHRIVFNYYPLINHEEDFMCLYDMIQENPFLKDPYKYVTHFEGVTVHEYTAEIEADSITFDDSVLEEYEAEKEAVIAQVKKDPGIIPRRLLKFAEKKKPKGYDSLSTIKPKMRVCVSNLKVDQYYYGELMRVKEELENAKQTLRHQ